jgi:purine nucleosidase
MNPERGPYGPRFTPVFTPVFTPDFTPDFTMDNPAPLGFAAPKWRAAMAPRKIIIDTDPGQDDAVALLLAFASPDELEVLGITVVAGNVPLNLTAKNALIICELAGKAEMRVFAGCDAPLSRTLVTAEHVHGKTGLDGPQLPTPRMALQDGHAVDFIIDTLRDAPAGTVTVCALGPLTNIATALQRAPDIAPKLAEIVLMGGAYFEVGNITPTAEFNIYVDPEAADIVFKSGIPLTVMPLDVTHKALTNAARVKAFRDMGTEAGRMVAEWTDFFERFDKEKYGSEGAPLHDPCVIAWLLQPELFSGRQINVEVETQSPLTLGMTVADWWRVTDRPANALFIGDIDADGFFALLTKRIARL